MPQGDCSSGGKAAGTGQGDSIREEEPSSRADAPPVAVRTVGARLPTLSSFHSLPPFAKHNG
eukprot:m.155764 g.155764  ORF g.155764 m.155764 type:complete len:62 (+) comp14419_c0_seq1:760-945(+)